MKRGVFKKVGVWAASIMAVGFLAYGCTAKGPCCKKPTSVKVIKPVPTQAKETSKVCAPLTQEIKKVFQDIHFNFNKYNLTYIDKWGIKQNVPAVLDRIAEFMKKHPKVQVIIEGNCDQRGSEEYNLALGWKRANAAKKYLVSKGISPDRIKTISYGKDRPLNPANNEYAWAQNRRDHFVVCYNCIPKKKK